MTPLGMPLPLEPVALDDPLALLPQAASGNKSEPAARADTTRVMRLTRIRE